MSDVANLVWWLVAVLTATASLSLLVGVAALLMSDRTDDTYPPDDDPTGWGV